MPELIHDAIQYPGGTKNSSITGGWTFNSDGIPAKNWSEVYYVLGELPTHTEDEILGTAGLPILGQPNRMGWCVSRTARCIDDSAKIWEVTCAYKSDVSIRVKTSTYEKDPVNFPGVYWPIRLDQIPAVGDFTTETIQEPLIRDTETLNGAGDDLQRIVNTVGEPMYPPVERIIIILNLDFYMMWNDRTYSYNWEEEFVNSTNRTEFMGAPVGSVLCSGLEYSPTGEIPYYAGMMPEDPANAPDLFPPRFLHFRAQFKFRFWYEYDCALQHLEPDPTQEGWILKLLNQGNTMLKKKRPDQPSNPEAEQVGAAAIDKAPIRANLDMNGYPLDKDQDPIWLQFNRYRYSDFDMLVDPAIIPFDIYTIPPIQAKPPCNRTFLDDPEITWKKRMQRRLTPHN